MLRQVFTTAATLALLAGCGSDLPALPALPTDAIGGARPYGEIGNDDGDDGDDELGIFPNEPDAIKFDIAFAELDLPDGGLCCYAAGTIRCVSDEPDPECDNDTQFYCGLCQQD